jgi:hypothetical protein
MTRAMLMVLLLAMALSVLADGSSAEVRFEVAATLQLDGQDLDFRVLTRSGEPLRLVMDAEGQALDIELSLELTAEGWVLSRWTLREGPDAALLATFSIRTGVGQTASLRVDDRRGLGIEFTPLLRGQDAAAR